MPIFLQGFFAGLAYAAPIGMQNVFVINSAVSVRMPRVLAVSFIVIFFDISLASACFFGIGAIIERFMWLRLLMSSAGSIFVLYMGFRLVLSKAEEVNPEKSNASIAKTICTAFFVTWLNPQAIIDGTLMLGAFRSSLSAEEAIPFMAGAAAASFSWFTGLSAVVSLFSSRFRSGTVRMINIISGSIMLFYGVSLMRSFFSLLGTNLL